MQQMLIRLLVAGLIVLPVVARADSVISSLPAAASPLSAGSCLYIDQGPGLDTKLCTDYGTALGINSAAANTIQGNFTASTGNATANAVPGCSDTGGNHLNYVTNTGLSCGTSTPAYARTFATPADPAGTTSATPVMMGLAVAFTPTVTGKAHIIVTGIGQNSVAAITNAYILRYGTGTAPLNGAASTGTQLGSAMNTSISTTGGRLAWTLDGYVSNLVVSTAYWIDISISTTAGDTATATSITAYAEEVP